MEKIKLGADEYTIVATIEDEKYIGDYDWHEGALLRDDEGNLVYIEGSGCSCNWLFDGYAEETPVKTAHEAVELAKKSFSDGDVFAFANQIFGPGRN